MFPAGRRFNPAEPSVDIGPIRTDEPIGLRVKKIAAIGDIGDGEALANNPIASGQMAVQCFKGAEQTALNKFYRLLWAFVFR